MELTYICENKNCRQIDKGPFMMKLNIETVMDEKNVAAMFCPHCKQPLNKERKAS